MPLSPTPEPLLDQLEGVRHRFEPAVAARVRRLLSQLAKCEFADPGELIRFHECLLFIRAFPRSAAEAGKVESILHSFHRRVKRLRDADADMAAFDDFDTSGIAGTSMQDSLSLEVVTWLLRRFPKNVDVAWQDYWEDYESERARGLLWPRFIPLLEEDADVEATIPWKHWLDAARGRKDSLAWLLQCFTGLPLPGRQQAELYGSLRLPIRWKVEGPKLSRSGNHSRPRRIFFHDAPLIRRSEVSLARELDRPAPKLESLSAHTAASAIEGLREFMVVRYRELYGATFGDPRTVVRVDLGRGVVLYIWGVLPTNRLPLRAYVCGYCLKNGVAINYFEAIGLCEWMEVGFNTFYTYRQGETAWVYAQILRCLRASTGVSVFSIYPYQIGFENDEAIDSGAFWFYRKLGFRSGRADLQELCEREEKRIAADPGYRTSPRVLRRLAEAHMFYEAKELDGRVLVNTPGAWDTFSVRDLGWLVNRRMASAYSSDSGKVRRAALEQIVRILRIDSSRWSRIQRQCLENWALVLSAIPSLNRWTVEEKAELIKIIRAKAALDENIYLRRTQRHFRLRESLLRLGSKTE
jgi:hypothetical protein